MCTPRKPDIRAAIMTLIPIQSETRNTLRNTQMSIGTKRVLATMSPTSLVNTPVVNSIVFFRSKDTARPAIERSASFLVRLRIRRYKEIISHLRMIFKKQDNATFQARP